MVLCTMKTTSAAHGFLEAGLELPVAEAAHGHFAQALSAELGDLAGQHLGGGAAEDLGAVEFVLGHGAARACRVKRAANVVISRRLSTIGKGKLIPARADPC
jgi:hypothetical protein